MSDDKPGFSLDRIMTMCPACGDGQRFFLMRSEVGKLVKAAREVLSETLPTSQADLKRFQALEAAVLKFTREA